MGYYEYGALPVLHTSREPVHHLRPLVFLCARPDLDQPPVRPQRHVARAGSKCQTCRSIGTCTATTRTTIYDRLNARRVPGASTTATRRSRSCSTHQWAPENAVRYRRFAFFFFPSSSKRLRGPGRGLPRLRLHRAELLPSIRTISIRRVTFMLGEALLARSTTRYVANEALWATTLLVVLYDEHGGFYNHVAPPTSHSARWTMTRVHLRPVRRARARPVRSRRGSGRAARHYPQSHQPAEVLWPTSGAWRPSARAPPSPTPLPRCS